MGVPVRSWLPLVLALCLCPTPASAKRRPKKRVPNPDIVERRVNSVIEDAPVAPDRFEARIKELKADIAKDMADLPSYLEKLQALTATYPATPDLDALREDRMSLRRTLDKGWRRIKSRAEEFHQIRKDYQFQQGVVLFSKMVAGMKDEDTAKNFETLVELGQYDKKTVLKYSEKIEAELKEDERIFQKVIRDRLEARRRKKYAAIGVGGLLLLLPALLLLKRRRTGSLDAQRSPMTDVPPQPTPIPLQAPKPPPKPADVVGMILGGRFKVEKLLSLGTLGPVYSGKDLKDDSPVVFKSIVEEFHRTTNDLARFLTRAKSLAEFRHKNLAEVREVLQVDDRLYIISQSVAGRPLSAFISPGNMIELRSIKLIGSQIALLLEAAHDKKLIHGDISPSNIIVEENGAVKILDFGVGIEARRAAAKLSLSRKIGNPAYLAPEQELGTEFRQSDFYSMAVLFYAMLTGQLPFEGPNYLAQKQGRRYAPASSLSDKIPVEVDPVLHKALEPEPQQRYQRSMDFFGALDAVPEKVE